MPIEKRLIGPKLYELRNVDRDKLEEPTPGSSSMLQAQMFDEAARSVQQQEHGNSLGNTSPKQRQQWRKQMKNYLKNWDQAEKAGEPFDIVQGVEELRDSGAIWMEEDGIYSAVPLHGKQKEAMVKAHDTWLDWQKDVMGQTEFDPKKGGWYNPNMDQEFRNVTQRDVRDSKLQMELERREAMP